MALCSWSYDKVYDQNQDRATSHMMEIYWHVNARGRHYSYFVKRLGASLTYNNAPTICGGK